MIVFLRKLIQEIFRGKVTLIIDADRDSIYTGKTPNDYFNKMRRYLIQNSLRLNINYLDLDIVFKQNYAKFKKEFDLFNDGHWNSYAAQIVADTFVHQINADNK